MSLLDCRALQWGPPGRALTPPLDWSLGPGELVAVVGANGVGKSSLLKTLAGLQRPLAGRVALQVARPGGLGYLLQQPMLDRQFPVSLATLVAAGLWRCPAGRPDRRQRLQAALADWGLDGLAERPLSALSGGQLQRALLARLALTEAPLLLLDEPDASLDAAGQALLWHHLARWQEQGRALAVVCHDASAVQRHASACLRIDPAGCRLERFERRCAA